MITPYARALLGAGLLLLASCQTADSTSAAPHQPITAPAASQYALYAMMAANAYEKTDGPHFALEKLGWHKIGLDGQPVAGATAASRTGLAYNLYRKAGTNEVVFAFRGTDSKRDWFTGNLKIMLFGIGSQYEQARREFDAYLAAHPTDKVTVTGHSLGGGICLSISVRKGIDAVVFDPSPRVSDGAGDVHRPAHRVLIYEGGEVLEYFRGLRQKIRDIIPAANIYRCAFSSPGDDKHSCALLARGLLELGAKENPELLAALASGAN